MWEGDGSSFLFLLLFLRLWVRLLQTPEGNKLWGGCPPDPSGTPRSRGRARPRGPHCPPRAQGPGRAPPQPPQPGTPKEGLEEPHRLGLPQTLPFVARKQEMSAFRSLPPSPRPGSTSCPEGVASKAFPTLSGGTGQEKAGLEGVRRRSRPPLLYVDAGEETHFRLRQEVGPNKSPELVLPTVTSGLGRKWISAPAFNATGVEHRDASFLERFLSAGNREKAGQRRRGVFRDRVSRRNKDPRV